MFRRHVHRTIEIATALVGAINNSAKIERAFLSSTACVPFRPYSTKQSSSNPNVREARNRKEYFKFTKAKAQIRAYNKYNLDLPSESDCADESEYVYGYHSVLAALKSNKRIISEILVRNSLFKLLAEENYPSDVVRQLHHEIITKELPLLPVNKRKLDKLTLFGVHQGICASVSSFKSSTVSLKNLPSPECGTLQPSMWVLIDQVKDPMNVGGLIRNSVFFGVSLILTTPKCSKLSPVVSKASSGAMESAPLMKVHHPIKLLQELKQLGWNIIGTVCESANSKGLNEIAATLTGSTLVVIGSEGYGIDNDLKQHCTHLLYVDSHYSCPPTLDSLNVSVASGIILYTLSSSVLREEGKGTDN